MTYEWVTWHTNEVYVTYEWVLSRMSVSLSLPLRKVIPFIYLRAFSVPRSLQGCEDPYDALSWEIIFRKRALQLVALLRKETCNLRHPMHLRHPAPPLYSLLHSSTAMHFWFPLDPPPPHTHTQRPRMGAHVTNLQQQQKNCKRAQTQPNSLTTALVLLRGAAAAASAVLSRTLPGAALWFAQNIRRYGGCWRRSHGRGVRHDIWEMGVE